jgi:iron complex transport system substrate-binding protein
MLRLSFHTPIKASLIGLILGVTVLGACSPHKSEPTRDANIGSTSLCADSYLIALAPDRIGALSWQAGSELSTADEVMTKHPRLWASREILAGTKMRLVTGPGDPIFGREDTLGLTWGEDFETVRLNAAALSGQFNLDISDFETDLANLSALPHPDSPPRILYLSRSGGSAGPGTFVDAVITAAGGINANDTPGWHTPALERTLQFNPDLIVTSFFGSDYAGVNDRAVRHSALRRYLSERPRVEIPGKLWPCAGPGLIEATQQLNAAILAL